jgi:hypothetical protein
MMETSESTIRVLRPSLYRIPWHMTRKVEVNEELSLNRNRQYRENDTGVETNMKKSRNSSSNVEEQTCRVLGFPRTMRQVCIASTVYDSLHHIKTYKVQRDSLHMYCSMCTLRVMRSSVEWTRTRNSFDSIFTERWLLATTTWHSCRASIFGRNGTSREASSMAQYILVPVSREIREDWAVDIIWGGDEWLIKDGLGWDNNR